MSEHTLHGVDYEGASLADLAQAKADDEPNEKAKTGRPALRKNTPQVRSIPGQRYSDASLSLAMGPKVTAPTTRKR